MAKHCTGVLGFTDSGVSMPIRRTRSRRPLTRTTRVSPSTTRSTVAPPGGAVPAEWAVDADREQPLLARTSAAQATTNRRTARRAMANSLLDNRQRPEPRGEVAFSAPDHGAGAGRVQGSGGLALGRLGQRLTGLFEPFTTGCPGL